jgi:hypothetical protein
MLTVLKIWQERVYMTIKTILVNILKIAFLTIVMFILFSLGTSLVGFGPDHSQIMTTETQPSGEQGMVALKLLLVCLIDVLILTYFILRSRLSGLGLILVTAIIYYGVKTFMSQIESWYFMTNITSEMLAKLFLMTVPNALLFPPVAVLVLGKLKKDMSLENNQDALLLMSIREWIGKIALLVIVVYPILYFGFGYFIAWKNTELRAFYGGTDPGNFFAHFTNVFRDNPWLYFFQILRGLLWGGLAVIVIRFMKDSAWKIVLFVAILFSLLMNDSLLIPNPLMPAGVRLTHFIETASSNFIWGCLIVAILLWHPKRTV